MTVTTFLRHIGRIKGMTHRRREQAPAGGDPPGRPRRPRAPGDRDPVPRLQEARRHRPGDHPRSQARHPGRADQWPRFLRRIVEMRKVVRNLGKNHAVIISSHILSEVSQTCDRILVIGEGRLVAQGTEDELLARSGDNARLVNHRARRRGQVRGVARRERPRGERGHARGFGGPGERGGRDEGGISERICCPRSPRRASACDWSRTPKTNSRRSSSA